MAKIKLVYIAGPLTPRGVYSPNPAIDYICNCRAMVVLAVKVLLAGFCPFVPAFDRELWMVSDESQKITEPMIKSYSISWLEVCDAVLLTHGWEKSKGIWAEIKRANELWIPVFNSLEELIQYSDEKPPILSDEDFERLIDIELEKLGKPLTSWLGELDPKIVAEAQRDADVAFYKERKDGRTSTL